VTSCIFFVWGAIHYWLAARAIGKDRV
jgi:hypothetical protein